MQVDDGAVLPDKASLFLTAIEDAEYKDDKIECELVDFLHKYEPMIKFNMGEYVTHLSCVNCVIVVPNVLEVY